MERQKNRVNQFGTERNEDVNEWASKRDLNSIVNICQMLWDIFYHCAISLISNEHVTKAFMLMIFSQTSYLSLYNIHRFFIFVFSLRFIEILCACCCKWHHHHNACQFSIVTQMGGIENKLNINAHSAALNWLLMMTSFILINMQKALILIAKRRRSEWK
jgi:hypothetical protein